MGIHILHCIDDEERTTSHDVVRNVFVSIERDAKFHALHELDPRSFVSCFLFFASRVWHCDFSGWCLDIG
jgi:hypothetical protein